MTTDTKVGLVVGLAFIVVFAVVLSNRGERSELAPPAIDFAGIDEAIPLLSAETNPAMVDPFTEPTPRRANGDAPDWYEPARPTRTVDAFSEHARPADADDSYEPMPSVPMSASVAQRNETPRSAPIAATPRPIMSPARSTPRMEDETVAINIEQHDAPAGVEKTHEIQSGDALSKIASAAYGSASPGIVKALAAYNGLDDPGLIQKGQTIRIPPVELLINPGDRPAPARTAQNASRRAAIERPAANDAGVYTVKAGDTLSRIARNELGQETRWTEILKLNRDRLKSPDRLTEGMKLRMPAPSVADAGRPSR